MKNKIKIKNEVNINPSGGVRMLPVRALILILHQVVLVHPIHQIQINNENKGYDK